MVSPGNKEGKINRTVLATAHLSGINKVFRIGGVEKVFTFGTKQISKVDVISGPGNIYVTTAKKQIYGSTELIP